ncbi:unnamed protein product [Rotaria magnacalcarata]|uniref:K Homology domain-containing protein n=4 Tax=Rotaria magnacalcarata TaxID=392030 RepID=A0A816ASW7_9BILA|nr:unnamed protein product [Rotaria magnacalcarata]
MDYTYGQSNDYPLRIVVPSDSVGAIIGKQGSTVKQIKQTARAKIDVNKNEASNNQERIIIIRGQQENCIQACREILRIMYEDAKNKNKTSEIILKVLAQNNFIGRIIGKGGNIINTIKKETDTNITVSSINELNSYNIERIISIKGELDQQMSALETIFSKLWLAYENENARAWHYSTQYYQQQQMMQNFAQHAAMIATVGATGPPLLPMNYSQQQQQQQSMVHQTQTNNSNNSSNKFMEQQPNLSTIYPSSYYPTLIPTSGSFYLSYPSANSIIASQPNPYANGNLMQQQEQLQLLQNIPVSIETVHLYVPNTVIGAIIGAKGFFIKSIMKSSNASVKINPVSQDEDSSEVSERQVTITGTPEAQWKSQYYIYDKIRQEGYFGEDLVRLRAEINVPTLLIGRLVGKGGHNVRQLQQSTGAFIKLPDDSQQTSASEVPVKIFGPFPASQFAQRRIQSIIQMSRDLANISKDDSNNNNNNNNNSSNEQLNGMNLNETSTIVNASTTSDDAVVASSTLPNTDASVTTVDDQK